jgi:hypothetical protein
MGSARRSRRSLHSRSGVNYAFCWEALKGSGIMPLTTMEGIEFNVLVGRSRWNVAPTNAWLNRYRGL